jgi:hypothetical protein
LAVVTEIETLMESHHRPGLQPDPSHTSVRACIQFFDTSHRVVMSGLIRIGKRYFLPTRSHYLTPRWFVCPGDSTLCVREVPTRVVGIILTTPASPRSPSCGPTACSFQGPLSHRILPRQESFASLHILTRRASEGSEALPSLARRVRMSFFGARVIRPHPTRAAANAAHILSGAAPVY